MSCSDRRKTLALLGLGLPFLASCGFRPLYGDGSPASAISGRIALGEITSIPSGAMAFDFRERLETRLGAATSAGFVLQANLTITSESRAIRQDNTITRFNLRGFADYSLLRQGGEEPLFTDRAASFTAYSATASAYATLAAERDAIRRLAQALADQIATRLASTADRWAQ